ncbi:MAG: lamin tail domain-containing protein [Mongoliibacter sp.]|uniref:lamin tail domain-containing protein n=1 Tax=Mongoliibacter sp. TaxID=2022438 RepID=UPI0012F1DF38|nr:lamin tail domain-containing protein [Mongoliibacter sp.]TVP47225.1 MAG: lamin tail domain-containing protein [Mongoliibacter sp.]
MMNCFLRGWRKNLLTLICIFNLKIAIAQVQDFEKDFAIVNHPEEFLPHWSANEVRASTSRVFQANSEGRFGSKALGVQAISSFNGLIYFKTSTDSFKSPKLAFFAKSKSNGSGNRPVLLFLSYSLDGVNFREQIQVGDDNTFPNRNSDFQLFEFLIPPDFQNQDMVWVKFEIRFGPGNGSAARFFMDDVGIFEQDQEIDPIQVKRTKVLTPYSFRMDFNRNIQRPKIEQVEVTDNLLMDLKFPSDTSLIFYTDEIIKDLTTVRLSNLIDSRERVTAEVSAQLNNEKISLGKAEIIRPNSIKLYFSQYFSPNTASQTTNYKVNGKSPSNLELLEENYSALLELNTTLNLDQTVLIEVENIANDQTVFNPEKSILKFQYEDYIEGIFASDEKTLHIQSALPLSSDEVEMLHFEIEEFPQFNFKVDLEQEFQIKLQTEQPLEEGINYTLYIPPRKSNRGLYIPGSSRVFVYDITPPELIEVILLEKTKLLLTFSEKIDPVYASILNNYKIGDLNPNEALVTNHQVILSWDFIFNAGKEYTLEIGTISDLNGNTSENLKKTFFTSEIPTLAFKDLVINELMPAPRPGNTLPNVEYVEIFNTTDSPIYLGGLQLANSRRVSILPSAVLDPKAYIILCPRNQSSQFEQFGKVLGLTNWPTLLNSADQVKLLDNKGVPLDSLNYSVASYGSSAYASGGYSLEIINPFLKCYLPTNLKVSRDAARGTPGKVNSVFEETPDLSPPKFLNAKVIDDNTIQLNFNKVLNQDTRNLKLQINPHISILEIEIGDTPSALLVRVDDLIKPNVKYLIRIDNLRDCSGNLFEEKEEVYFVLPDESKPGEIVINEVLFNPRTGAPKFVEIYNCSAKFLNLKDWKLANLNTSDEIANRRILFSDDMIIEPFSFLVFTTDAAKLKQEYPKGKENRFVEYSSLPSYPISAGNVVFLNPDEDIVEIFSYSERMHHPLLKEKRGVSLERLSALSPIDDPNNWQTASASEGYASPGYKNSQNFDGNTNMGIEISPKVFIPEAAGEQPFTTISYKMEQAGKIATLRIYSPGGVLIKELCQNAVWGESGFYLWDGTDSNNRKVRPGYYIVWLEVFDLQGKVTQIRKTVVVGTKF